MNRRTALAALGALSISTLTGDDKMTGKFGAEAGSDPQFRVASKFRDLDRQIRELQTARTLQAASIGQGGLRLHSGGGIVVQGSDGEGDVFRVSSDPVELFLRPELVQSLAVQIFAARVFTGHVAAQQTTTSASYTDLATVGPVVPNVPISASRKAIVWLSALVEANCASPSGGGVAVSADMGFDVTGATTQAAGISGRFLMQSNFDSAENTSNSARMGITCVVDGLNEGQHTFTCKYRRVQGTAPVPFAERSIVVLAL